MEEQRLSGIFNNIRASGGRKKTRIVHIGDIPMGGDYPVRIQSMTNTPTLDTEASVAQCKRIFDAGADYVRLTAQSIREAENLGRIREQLTREGYPAPLIADVHFNPAVAEIAAGMVEKIRINPGNFIRFENPGDTRSVPERIREQFVPLLEVCKKNNTALRIGVNHGSLAERMVEKYGDTPEGMVLSAMEYLDICREEDFHQVVFSMKSSNTRVMVAAYRLLIAMMASRGELYPLHLGVTEAGEGAYGRIKSVSGMAALLADGFGDTLRVSLTEPPEDEIPVAYQMARWPQVNQNPTVPVEGLNNRLFFKKREVSEVLKKEAGTGHIVIVTANSNRGDSSGMTPDLWYTEDSSLVRHPSHRIIVPSTLWETTDHKWCFPLFNTHFPDQHTDKEIVRFIEFSPDKENPELLQGKTMHPGDVFVVSVSPDAMVKQVHLCLTDLEERCPETPVVLKCVWKGKVTDNEIINLSALLGPLFLDGLAEGIWLDFPDASGKVSACETAFNLLQATRIRFSRPEYISCPSCGRTLFDIQKVSARIRERTAHLKGLKIGIMGCIVNGPGEMADADYGYVGSGPNKVNLYKNRRVVKRNVAAVAAVDELVRIIKENGDWVDP